MAGDNWILGKQNHRLLSSKAADSYDEIYESSNFATGSYMQYEIDIIKKWAPEVPNNDVALDLGCGTGRDSFVLCTFFTQVFGYDFSPEMVIAADKNKIKKNIGNVSFNVRDIEDELLPQEDSSVAFVNTAFGMGSFVENIDRLLKELKRVLIPEGIAVISCYNSNALVNQLDLTWKPAIAARVGAKQDSLDVNFNDETLTIASKSYKMKDVKKRIEHTFGPKSIVSLTTFPTLAALFPQELFNNEKARDLCTNVDYLLASNDDIAFGPYIVAVIKNPGRFSPDKNAIAGYRKVLDLLRVHKISESRLKYHKPASTISDIVDIFQFDLENASLVKSILVTDTTEYDERYTNTNLYLVAIPAHKKLDFSKLAKFLGLPRARLRMATFAQVEDVTGFYIGSIPPFGLPKSIPVIFDKSIQSQNEVWCGTGKPTESLRLTLQELVSLCTPSYADISK